MTKRQHVEKLTKARQHLRGAAKKAKGKRKARLVEMKRGVDALLAKMGLLN